MGLGIYLERSQVWEQTKCGDGVDVACGWEGAGGDIENETEGPKSVTSDQHYRP